MSTHFEIKSPTRVDLAGGTLDLWPLYNFFGGAQTVNMAITVYTHVSLDILPNSTNIIIESQDLNLKKFYTDMSSFIQEANPELSFYRAVFNYFKPHFGFHLKTRSESPVGGGLGGSSSLMISLLKAFSQALLKPFASVHQMVEVAHNLEAEILFTPTGTQDYYPAASGGINLLQYSAQGIKQSIFDHKNLSDIESRFLLVYTGRSHHSGMNNFEVLQKAVARDPQTIRALSKLRIVADEMTGKVRAGLWDQLKDLFNREYDARIQLAPAIMSPEIETLHKLTLNAGAEAVKICGAGGGGCILVWCPPEKRTSIAHVCSESGYQVIDAKPCPTNKD